MRPRDLCGRNTADDSPTHADLKAPTPACIVLKMNTKPDSARHEPLTRTGALPWTSDPRADPAPILARVSQLSSAGRFADAEQVCRTFLATFPASVAVLNALALVIQRRNNWTEAESLLRRAIEHAPNEAALHNNLGNVLLQQEKVADAEVEYRAAIRLNPRYAEAFYNLGNTLRQLGRPEEALPAQRKAVALNASYAPARVQIAVMLSEQGDFSAALDELDQAIAANPKLFDALYYRGTMLATLERYDEAIAAFQAAVALRPDRHEGHFALANARASLGQDVLALESYEGAIKATPGFLHAHNSYTNLAWTMGLDAASKLDTFAYARSRLGDTADLLLAESEFRIRFGDLQSAEQLLRRAGAKEEGRADILNALALTLSYQSRHDECVSIYKDAIGLEPNVVRHRQDLGIALLRAHEPGEAATALEDALAIAQHDQRTLGHLSLAYRWTDGAKARFLFDPSKYVREFEIAPPSGFASVEAFNEALRAELVVLHTSRVEPLFQTLKNGTQTRVDLFSRPTRAIQALRERILEAVAAYVRDLETDSSHPFSSRREEQFSFAGSWSCLLRNGFHTNHIHPKGWISSAYYVSLPDAVADSPDRQSWLKFGESNLSLGEADAPERFVRPEVGKLVLFPSYFWHGTVPFFADESRLAVAFDVRPGPATREVPDWAKPT